jgi:hypothetical protein
MMTYPGIVVAGETIPGVHSIQKPSSEIQHCRVHLRIQSPILCKWSSSFDLIFSETSEYSDWTEEVGMNTRQQSESQRPSRRVRRVLSSSDEEGESSTRPPKPVKKENDRPKKAPKKKKKKVIR